MPTPSRPLNLEQVFARQAAATRRANRSSSIQVQRKVAQIVAPKPPPTPPSSVYQLDGWDTAAGSYRVPEGITADGNADVTADLQSWLGSLPSGARAVLRTDGAYRVSGPGLVLDRPVWIDGGGARIVRSTNGTTASPGPALRVRSSDLRVSTCDLVGPGSAPYAGTHEGSGVYAVADSWAGRYARIQLEDMSIYGWGFAGVWVEYANDVHVRGCRFFDNSYANCHWNSVQRGSYVGNRGDDLSNSGRQPQTYGFAANRWSPFTLAAAPRCEDILVADNWQRNTFWECLDTHAGKNIRFLRNTTVGKIGVAVVASKDPTGQDGYAPIDCRVEGNTHDSGVDNGTMSSGITFTGAEGTQGAGTFAELATGWILNNTIRRAGSISAVQEAMYVHCTKGVTIAGNKIYEPAVGGMQLRRDNYDLAVVDNYVEESWSSGTFCCAMRFRDGFNDALVERNRYRATGTKAGSAKSNDRGLYLPTATSTSLVMGWNDFAGNAQPLSPATSTSYVPMYA